MPRATTDDLPITKRPNLAYVVVRYEQFRVVLVRFRVFWEAIVQQFVQQFQKAKEAISPKSFISTSSSFSNLMNSVFGTRR